VPYRFLASEASDSPNLDRLATWCALVGSDDGRVDPEDAVASIRADTEKRGEYRGFGLVIPRSGMWIAWDLAESSLWQNDVACLFSS
jgi:hypothetical protein